MDFNASHATATIYIRIVALSIGFYDYLVTLPAEWLLYRSQRSWRLSPGCILFIAIRYTSILALLTSNVGYFGHFFSEESCAKYYMIPPVLKVIQTMVSQLILGIRTINISRRAPWVLWTIIIAFVLTSAAEGFLNLSNRVPLQGWRSNCTAGDRPPHLTVWVFYVFAMLYDVITLCISSVYLTDVSPSSVKMGRLVRRMLTDGLVYFVALIGVNILNLILYRSTDEAYQSSGVTLGYTLTWIMSQRILIHLREATAEHNQTQIIASHQLSSAHSISQAIHFEFKSKGRSPLSSAFDLEDRSVASCARDRVSTRQTEGRTSISADGIPTLDDIESQSQDSESVTHMNLEGGEASEFQHDGHARIRDSVTVEYNPDHACTQVMPYDAGDIVAGAAEAEGCGGGMG